MLAFLVIFNSSLTP